VRRLFAVVLGAGALALAGAARAAAPRPLATPWPSQAGCSSQTLDTMGLPDIHVCRVSVFARGRRLGDYVPSWPKIELPDGGAVHLLDAAERVNERRADEPGDQIIVIGSALAQ
jgi:hypothetical protein